MIELIKNFLLLKKILKKNKLINNWFFSLKKSSFLNEKNEYLPWFNYNLISFLEERLQNKKFSVFEYGCGYSTLFWSNIAIEVTSLENKQNWYNKIQFLIEQNNTKNINLFYQESNNFINYIEKFDKKFDIIVIDSFARIKCIKKSVNFLSENGIIILDNSDRAIYKRGINFLLKNNFKKLDFNGLSPNTIYTEKSTIFYKISNIIDL